MQLQIQQIFTTLKPIKINQQASWLLFAFFPKKSSLSFFSVYIQRMFIFKNFDIELHLWVESSIFDLFVVDCCELGFECFSIVWSA